MFKAVRAADGAVCAAYFHAQRGLAGASDPYDFASRSPPILLLAN
jgi:hypothetical protein